MSHMRVLPSRPAKVVVREQLECSEQRFGRPTQGLFGLIVHHEPDLNDIMELLKRLSGQHVLEVRRVERHPKHDLTCITLFMRSPFDLHPFIAGMSCVSSVVWPIDSFGPDARRGENMVAIVTLATDTVPRVPELAA